MNNLLVSRSFETRVNAERSRAANFASHLFQDPFAAAAFKAAEDDGLAPDLVEIDHPKHLDGGAAEVAPDTGRQVQIDPNSCA
jgi:hypothetical protein